MAHIRRNTDVALREAREERVGRLDQAVADGKGHSSCPVLAIRLVEDVREVRGDRFLAEDKFMGDLRVGHASGYKAQHLHLSLGESCGVGGRNSSNNSRW